MDEHALLSIHAYYAYRLHAYLYNIHACICINHQCRHACNCMHDHVCKYLHEHWYECMHLMHACISYMVMHARKVCSWPCMHVSLHMHNMHTLAWVWSMCMLNMNSLMRMHACTHMHVHMYACIFFMRVYFICMYAHTCMHVHVMLAHSRYACLHL